MTDDWIFYVSGQVAAIASEVSELPRHKTRGKEASVLLNTLYVSENNSALSEGLHAGMSVCMCVCVFIHLSLFCPTCNHFSVVRIHPFFLTFLVITRASTPSSLPPSVSFFSTYFLHKIVFKLCVSFIPFSWGFAPRHQTLWSSFFFFFLFSSPTFPLSFSYQWSFLSLKTGPFL